MIPYKISDLLARLKTSKTIIIPYNVELLAILNILQSIGIVTIELFSNTIKITVIPNSFSEIVLHSKPSRRIYKSYKNIWTKNLGLGVSIIRTSQGFKTTNEARKEQIGGELLFTIF